jgi:hypothetical protein
MHPENLMRRSPGRSAMLTARNDIDGRFDLDALLHPSGAFAHPLDVIGDPDLTLSEMRAILSSWAAEACGMDDAQGAPRPRSRQPVAFDDIVEALHEVDRKAAERSGSRDRRSLSRCRPSILSRKQRPSGGQGPTPN